MSGGRWDPQTRIAVVVVGMLVVTIGALSTVQWRSGIGAAALVIGGLLVGLAGVAGGTIFGPRESSEIRIVTGEQPALKTGRPGAPAEGNELSTSADGDSEGKPAARPPLFILEGRPFRRAIPAQVTAQEAAARAAAAREATAAAASEAAAAIPLGPGAAAGPDAPVEQPRDGRGQDARVREVGRSLDTGDTESATGVLARHLRALAPQAHAYHDAVLAALGPVLEGRRLVPVAGQLLGPLVVAGLPVAIDIRAGSGFSPALVRRTYQLIFENMPQVGAMLTVINTPSAPAMAGIAELRRSLGQPVIAVPWRVGEPTEQIIKGFALVCVEGRAASSSPGPETTAAAQSAAAPIAAPSTAPPPPLPSARSASAQPARGATAPSTRGATAPSTSPAARSTARVPATPSTSSPGGGAVRVGQSANRPVRYDDSATWRHASDLHWRGQLQEAEESYRAIVDTRGRMLGWDAPETLTARDQHATVLRDLDRLAEALVECDEVLATRTRLLGADHAETLTSRSHLATIYHQLGDLTRAESEHSTVLEARIRLLGSRSADTLITRSNLAKVYQDLGELDRAIDEHSTVMRERAEVLGPEHRDTLMSRSLLASALHQAGRLEDAETQHRAVLSGRLRELGPSHLDTAVSRHRLASVLHDLHRLDEAIDEYRAAREVYTDLLGATSPFARAAASDLALAERARRAGHPGTLGE